MQNGRVPDVHTPPSYSIRSSAGSAAELLSLTSALREQNPGRVLMFRGQTHNYLPTPSAAREPATPEERLRRRYAAVTWEAAAAAVMPGYLPHQPIGTAKRIALGMAVLQHYGFRSWFIDITPDPMIAAWFSRWRYKDHFSFIGIGDHNDEGPGSAATHHAMSQIRLARYERYEDEGVIDVFAVHPGSQLVLNLEQDMPPEALRVHRQRGAGLLPDEDGTFGSSHIARISASMNPDELQDQGGAALSQSWLFPDTNDDRVYAALMRAPRPIPEEDIQHHASMAQDLLDLPVYMSEQDPAFWSWLEGVDAVAGMYATLPQQPELGDKQVASDITLPFTPFGGPVHDFTRDRYLEALADDDAGNSELDDRPSSPKEDEASSLLDEDSLRSAWPAFPVLLRTCLAGELDKVLARGDTFPLLRGYLFDLHDGIFLAHCLFEDQEGYYLSRQLELVLPWSPAEALRLMDAQHSTTQEEVIDALDGETWDRQFSFVVGLNAELYTRALLNESAFLNVHGPRSLGYYWDLPDGVVAIGTRWTPSASSGVVADVGSRIDDYVTRRQRSSR